jgi:hypothetical protein
VLTLQRKAVATLVKFAGLASDKPDIQAMSFL